MSLFLYILIMVVSAFLYHWFFLRSHTKATLKPENIVRSSKGVDGFQLNESMPLTIGLNLRSFPLMLIVLACAISSHFVVYYFTGVSPTQNWVYPFADGLGLFLVYNFTLFSGLRPAMLSAVYIDQEKVSFSNATGTVKFERPCTRVYRLNIVDGLYHCVLRDHEHIRSIFVDQASMGLLHEWAVDEGSGECDDE